MANNIPTVPLGKVVNGELIPADAWMRFFQSITSDVVRNNVNVGSLISGVAQAVETTATALAAETAARVAGDSAVSGSGDGAGVSNSGVYSNVSVTSATWVEAAAVLVTPTGPPGEYTFTIFADMLFGGAVVSDNGTFNGLWRIVEMRVSDSDETVIASGAFTGVYIPAELISEGGGAFYVPAYVELSFSGLPSSPVAATYDTTQTELRLELSRASGSNTISGLSGSVAVAWSA